MTDGIDRALFETIAQGLHRSLSASRSRAWHEKLAAKSGVHLERSGYSILSSLDSEDGQRLTDLAEQFGLDQSVVSRRVAALERAGFVERRADENDGRVSRLSLSPSGRTAVRRHRDAITEVTAQLLEDWPEESKLVFARALSAYADAVEAAVQFARVAPSATGGDRTDGDGWMPVPAAATL